MPIPNLNTLAHTAGADTLSSHGVKTVDEEGGVLPSPPLLQSDATLVEGDGNAIATYFGGQIFPGESVVEIKAELREQNARLALGCHELARPQMDVEFLGAHDFTAPMDLDQLEQPTICLTIVSSVQMLEHQLVTPTVEPERCSCSTLVDIAMLAAWCVLMVITAVVATTFWAAEFGLRSIWALRGKEMRSRELVCLATL